MYIKKVKFEQFGPYEDLELELEQGLVGIFGENGSGKTFLVNGIYAALTNDFSRFDGTKIDQIRDLAEDSQNSYVQVEAEHEGTTFVIRRSLRPNRSELVIGNDKPITKANEIEIALRSQLGVDSKLISTYVFVDQNEISSFLAHTPAQRAEAFKHLCKTEEADLIYASCGEMLAANQISDDVIDNSDDLLARIGEAKAAIAKLDDESADQYVLMLNEKSLKSAKKLVRKRERYDEQYEYSLELKAQIEEVKEAVASLAPKRQAKVLRVNARKQDVVNSTVKARDAAAALKTWQVFVKRSERKRTLQESAAKLQPDSKAPKVPKGWDKQEEVVLACDELKQRRYDAAKMISEFEEFEGGFCPTCGQAVDEKVAIEARMVLKSTEEEAEKLATMVQAFDYYKRAMKEYDRVEGVRSTKLESIKEELASLDSLEEPQGDVDELKDQVEQHNGLVSQLEELEAELQRTGESWTRLNTRLDGYKASYNKAVEHMNDNHVAQAKLDKANKRLLEHTAAELRVAELRGQYAIQEQRLVENEKQLEKLRVVLQRRKKIHKAMKLLKAVREVFHWNELPRLVAQGNLYNMEGSINEKLGWFGDPFWAEADEQLNFLVHFPGHPARRAQALSGGQQGVFAVAFRCAVNSLFGVDIGMMYLDEPTANLDEQNVTLFGEALHRLAAEVRGKRQLVMITHHAELKSAFDQVVEIATGG